MSIEKFSQPQKNEIEKNKATFRSNPREMKPEQAEFAQEGGGGDEKKATGKSLENFSQMTAEQAGHFAEQAFFDLTAEINFYIKKIRDSNPQAEKILKKDVRLSEEESAPILMRRTP